MLPPIFHFIWSSKVLVLYCGINILCKRLIFVDFVILSYPWICIPMNLLQICEMYRASNLLYMKICPNKPVRFCLSTNIDPHRLKWFHNIWNRYIFLSFLLQQSCSTSMELEKLLNQAQMDPYTSRLAALLHQRHALLDREVSLNLSVSGMMNTVIQSLEQNWQVSVCPVKCIVGSYVKSSAWSNALIYTFRSACEQLLNCRISLCMTIMCCK